MNIVHVLSSFGLGGQERMAANLAALQRAAGHRICAVSLAAGPEGPLATEFREHGVHVDSVPKGDGLDGSLPLRLARYLRHERADVVHTHNPHALIYGAPAAGIARAPVVHTKHGANPDRARRRWLRRVAATLADACVAVTPALAARARADRECDPERLCVIPNGVDLARFAPNAEARLRIRRELGIPADAWVAGSVGRLAPEKDQMLLLDAMRPLLDERRQLVVVGEGSERAALERHVRATFRAEYVHLVGERRDVAEMLSAFDVFVLTSKTEGLPLVLLEAMATELPVVSTAVGGIPDVLEQGVTGFLCAPGCREALTRELVRLVGAPTLARRMGVLGRGAVTREYSLELMAKRYETLYTKVIEGHRRRETDGSPLALQA